MQHERRFAAGESLELFTPAITDLLNLRIEQVEQHGHTPAKDDRSGPRHLIDRARSYFSHARDDAGYGEWPMVADQLRRVRRNLLRTAAMLIAAIDTIDRRIAALEQQDPFA
jgi:hypothetical protein